MYAIRSYYVRDLTENRVFAAVLDEAVRSVREGEGLAPSLARDGIFPPLVRRMVESYNFV